ncbi:hypothetical protein [Pseudoduganella sp. HUAS MS19]
MVDFAKADFGTNPSPLTITVAPAVVGSNQVKLQLQPLPSFTISYTPDGSGWEKFNADTLRNAATTIIGVITPFITATLQSTAQSYLDGMAVTVPAIPIEFDGIKLTLTPDKLNISTADSEHVLVTASVSIA